ncbi:hypothetical protein GCK72_025114 [Caenorhabditis remanei]|uniref:Uncharacterized protein n=1 Tax=Caenorhabditis remanei TaxID=31234 RepID=A0A6A5G118_CAERE|nr:hypothetical protein GCK72_025114 [Caenorhabditis remanei]KAF1748647.1 hypothetical protein GCK72_025114 [Caenorhabditis remanei]
MMILFTLFCLVSITHFANANPAKTAVCMAPVAAGPTLCFAEDVYLFCPNGYRCVKGNYYLLCCKHV